MYIFNLKLESECKGFFSWMTPDTLNSEPKAQRERRPTGWEIRGCCTYFILHVLLDIPYAFVSTKTVIPFGHK